MNPFRALALEPLARLAPSTKLIWCFLALEGGVVEAGINPLSKTLALADKSVRLGLKELETLGLIEVVDAGRGPKPKRVRAVAPPPSPRATRQSQP
jgi:hypothetical protein